MAHQPAPATLEDRFSKKNHPGVSGEFSPQLLVRAQSDVCTCCQPYRSQVLQRTQMPRHHLVPHLLSAYFNGFLWRLLLHRLFALVSSLQSKGCVCDHRWSSAGPRLDGSTHRIARMGTYYRHVALRIHTERGCLARLTLSTRRPVHPTQGQKEPKTEGLAH